MTTPRKPIKAKIPGSLTAAILAVVTLGAFAILQDYGPVSAVRRFHEAVAKGDAAALQQVVMEPVKDEDVQYLVQGISNELVNHVQPVLARTDRQGDQDDVVVTYNQPNGQTLAIVWIVDHRNSLWKINADQTATALRQSLGQQIF